MTEQIRLMCRELSQFLTTTLGQDVLASEESFDLLEYFENLPIVEQREILKNLMQYYSIMLDAIANDVDLNNVARSIQHSMSWNQINIHEEIYSNLTKNSVVEYFDMNLRQFWRSSNFFRYSSHPLEVLFVRPFQLNFKKEPEKIEEKISKTIDGLLSGEAPYYKNVTGYHKIIEIGLDDPRTNIGRVEFVSFIYKNEKPIGIASVIEVKETVLSLV